MAEWLGTGLQNLLHRFESGSDLNPRKAPHAGLFLFPILGCASWLARNPGLEITERVALPWVDRPSSRIGERLVAASQSDVALPWVERPSSRIGERLAAASQSDVALPWVERPSSRIGELAAAASQSGKCAPWG